MVGIALRCVALDQPLLDNQLLRQTQTAAATASLDGLPGFPLASRISWQGDLSSLYVQELPIYNYLVIGINTVTGNLDLSGKLVSVLLWGLGFLILQRLWNCMALTGPQVFWANMLFVFSPMSVFFGQTFMPEMLVQMLALLFVLLIARYVEQPTVGRWLACSFAGLAGLLVKTPEIAHLYLLLALLLWPLEKWRLFWRPRYLVMALVSLAALKGWGTYVDSVNLRYLPEWSTAANLKGFIGTLHDRLDVKGWVILAGYIGGLLAPGAALVLAFWGFWKTGRSENGIPRLLRAWLWTGPVFYLLWAGNGGNKQNYYNLPMLVPVCALFGLGTVAFLRRFPGRKAVPWLLGAVVIGCCLPGTAYYFQRDNQILHAAEWLKQNTKPGEVILFRPNHRWDMIDYPYNPTLAYYSGRPTFVWTRNTPEDQRREGLERARYAVITLPPQLPTGLKGKWLRFRGGGVLKMQEPDWLEPEGFSQCFSTGEFTVLKRRGPDGKN